MDQSNRHAGHRDRLRKLYIEKGCGGLNDEQMLELLLFYAVPRRDTRPLAEALTARFGSLAAALGASLEELLAVEGVGENAAVLLSLVANLCPGSKPDDTHKPAILNTTEDVGHFVLPFFRGEHEEVVFLVSLDAKCKVLDCVQIARGGVNSASISVRKILSAALASGASSVVLAHNHTSGIALPSPEDERTTLQLRDALKLIGVILADHVVVADDDFVSMAANGLLSD